MSITIAHLSDLHFGYGHFSHRHRNGQNVRERDFERAGLACAQHIADVIRPDLVIISGDLLQSTRVSSTGLNAAITFGRTLTDAGLPTVVISGNHDEAKAGGRFSDLQTCANHSGITLVREQEQLDIAGVRLHLVPFRPLWADVQGRDRLRPFDFSDDLANVLVAHGYAAGPGIPTPPDGKEIHIPEPWIGDRRFALGCLGHIHQHRQISDRMFFAGPTERRNFGEIDETPGFWIHEIEDGHLTSSRSVLVHDLIPSLPRPMIELTIAADQLTAAQLADSVLDELRKHDLRDAMVKLILTNVSSDIDRSHARQAWQRHFREAGGFTLEDVLQTRQIAELFDVEFDALPVNVAEGFHKFLAEQPFSSDEERIAMLSLAAEVMTSAHESLLNEDAA